MPENRKGEGGRERHYCLLPGLEMCQEDSRRKLCKLLPLLQRSRELLLPKVEMGEEEDLPITSLYYLVIA
jgi:hypothetical protein